MEGPNLFASSGGMNSPTSINVVASNAAVIPDNVDLQVGRGAAIHNHAEEEPVYGFHLPPFMTDNHRTR